MTIVLAPSLDTVVNIVTGELLVLQDATIDELVETRAALGQLWADRNTAAAMVDAELVRRADAALLAGELTGRTFQVGPYKVEVSSPETRRVDAKGLRADLLARVERGELELSEAAVENLFIVKDYALHQVRWKALRGAVPQLAEILDLHLQPTRRTASVTRTAIEAHAEETTT